jgi:beta-glucosidase-like glycosyl hydrolase/CubicO group peptidase (beta-lactamase class C family)
MRAARPALLIALGLATCRTPPPSPQLPPATPTPSAEEPAVVASTPEPSPDAPPADDWAARTLAGLSLEQKAAQLIGVRTTGLPVNPASAEARALRERVRTLGVGALVVFESEVGTLPRLLNELQAESKLPLLVAADMERGMSFRVRSGVVPLPYAMAVGATRSEEEARFTGEVTAREGRALGVHWAFAPVADVNSNASNPVINIRSYGEDPGLVARLSAAFVAGCRTGGLLTTAKHFPGHGDTEIDSHLNLAEVAADRARLEAVELLPFRQAVAAGVDAVMIGHLAVPALDPSGAPATLSRPVSELLRGEIGFGGLIVTDAMDMAGARGSWTGEAAVLAIKAGADMILLPPDPEVAVQALVRAVREGALAEARLDESVQRILEAKQRLGLHRQRLVDLDAVAARLARPEDVERALELARRSITVVRNEGGLLPLRSEQPLRLLHLVLSSDVRNRDIQGIVEEELARRRIDAETVALGPEVADETVAELVARAGEFSHVLASAFVRVRGAKGTAEMSPSHARLLRALGAAGRPVLVVSYGSPYLLRQFPELPVYVCAYGSAESSQRAAVAALFGEYAVAGKLPVSLPGLYPYGHGLSLPRHDMTLRRARPEEVGFSSDGLGEVDRAIERAVAERAFPGAVLAVGKDGALVRLAAFGRLSYEPGAGEAAPDTIYDLASLTKVVCATTAAMILVDEGRLDLAKPVSSFLPGFRGGAKDKVTVRHLLTHSSGLDWWAPLYRDLKGQAEFVARIQGMDLVYEPGTKSLYSDLGLILLGEILERVAGEGLEPFIRTRLLVPLGMRETCYRPGLELVPRIAPTEQDAWRGRLLRGEVHDENAYALGGVASHAGLFGTASDLARFAQMLLNGGVYDHRRIVSRQTLEAFTRRAGVPGSSRALGWDTPSEGSSAGTLLSSRSFGHTGFTGTSLWIDPERKLFVILLTNRVHPTRENDAIRRVRPLVADAVVRAIAGS